MKYLKKILLICFSICFCFAVTGCGTASNSSEKNNTTSDKKEFCIVSSFYPMQILTMNLTDGIKGVRAVSMSDPNMGCIHDHTFTTDDLKKVEGADVYIENGLGMETFNDQIKKAYPNTNIIEASADVKDYVKESDDDDMDGNAHVWTDLDDYILQVKYVGDELQKLNPENKAKYSANAKSYVDKLTKLKDDYADKLKAVEGKKVLVLDETLPNFCLFAKLDEMEIKTDHDQESLSASDIKNVIATMKKDNVKTILLAKNSNRRNAETIAKETGAAIYELNSCMVGEETKDAYLNDMKENFDIISSIQ